MHPACGQTASKARKVPAAGCTTSEGSPEEGSWNEAAPPTGTSFAGPIFVPGGVLGGVVDCDAGDEVVVVELAVLPLVVGVVPLPRAGAGEPPTEEPNRRPRPATSPPPTSTAAETAAAAPPVARTVRRSSSFWSIRRARGGSWAKNGQGPGAQGCPLRAWHRPSSYWPQTRRTTAKSTGVTACGSAPIPTRTRSRDHCIDRQDASRTGNHQRHPGEDEDDVGTRVIGVRVVADGEEEQEGHDQTTDRSGAGQESEQRAESDRQFPERDDETNEHRDM